MQEQETIAVDSNPTTTNTEQIVERNPNVVNDDNKSKIKELDKFKRRLIRATARLMVVEKKPEEEIWKELKKETNYDCKVLWTRMRALTIKKLKRLLAASDNNKNISKIAQLSVTDWLLFDLVLVHEDVDVIGMDLPREKGKDLPILNYLYRLVLKYRIEHLIGDPLTLAWHDLTAEYNSRGRKCSPMLLQLRWYQFKKQIRHKFYSFWYEYRGSSKKLPQADRFKPTELEMAIVKRFMSIVTDRFKSWEELIEEQKVSLFSDFERLQLLKKNNPSYKNEPDVLLIEPKVDTIDLRVESDDDSNDDIDNANPNKEIEKNTTTAVKTETVYDICDEDGVSALESMYIPLETNVSLAINSTNKKIMASDIEGTNIAQDEVRDSPDQAIECIDTDLDIEVEETNFDNDDNHVEVSAHNDLKQDIDFNQQKNLEKTQPVKNNEFLVPKITCITSNADITEIDITDDSPDDIDNIVNKESSEIVQNIHQDKNVDSNFLNQEVPNDVISIDGIELEDDGIEYIEEEELLTEPKTELDESNVTEENDTPTIDPKLLLTPVVYTKKLDHMDVFRFLEYTNVKDKRVIETADFESKSVHKKSVEISDVCDEKLSEVDNETDTDSECVKEEQELINPTSWLFRKPIVKSYNPIQLCKNPDFNTRLKRLTAGFFTSPRNRQLLKQCKPLTIDVHKSIELNLVNGTVLLKKSNFSKAKETESETKSIEKTVIPSELPGQRLEFFQDTTHLITNPPTSTMSQENKSIDEVKFTSEMCPSERKKAIILPDIDQIRRANEKLLIAEVSPLLNPNVTNTPPVAIVPDNKSVEQDLQVDKYIERELESNVLDNTTCETVKDIPETENKVSESKDEIVKIIPSIIKGEKLTYHLRKKLGLITKKDVPYKVRPVSVSWTPKLMSNIENNHSDDRLLARDTVERIMNVCKGIAMPVKKKQNSYGFQKRFIDKNALKKQDDSVIRHELTTNNEENVLDIPNEEQSKQINVQLASHNDHVLRTESKNAMNENDHVSQTQKNDNIKKRKVRRSKYNFCCWARAKLEFFNNKITYVKLKHKCPQYKCMCCCNVEFCEELKRRRKRHVANIVPCFNLVSDDSSDHNAERENDNVDLLKIAFDQNLKQSPTMVDIGTNTDYDADFEKSFAENLSNLNNCILNQPITTKVISLAKEASSNNATQTYAYKAAEPEPRVSFPSTINISNMPETVTPLHTSISSSHLEVLLNKDKLQKIQPKCKTKIYAPPDIENKLSLEQNVVNASSLKSPNYDTKISPIIVTSPNKPPNKNLKNIRSLKPICLGKNKILLCSINPLNKTDMVDVTYLANNFTPQNANSILDPTKLIPKGAHLVLLPNQELVLSVDPGAELDPSKINHLPAIIASVQQQLYNAGIINQPPNSETLKQDDIIQLPDYEKESENVIYTFKDSSKLEHLKKNSEVETKQCIRNNEEYISYNKLNKTNNANHTSEDRPLNELNIKTIYPIISPSNLDDDSNKKGFVINEDARYSEIDTSSEKVLPVDSLLNACENNEVTDGFKLEQFTKGDLKDTTVKKTILSDLMAMSGISLEDTANVETPLIQQQTLHPVISPEKFTTGRLSLPSEMKDERDNSLLSNPSVQAALSKFPDLHILYSFEDLRYACANNFQFYKMDTKTGFVAPINVCIKKQLPRMKMTKDVIDLTQEDTEQSEISNTESKSEENKDASGIIENKIKPIKLFKTIHPSILKHNFKSFVGQPKCFQTPNLKSKRNNNLINHKNVGESKRSKYAENEKMNTYSDSDDEPLSLKAKRIRKLSKDPSNIGGNESNIENDQENKAMPLNHEVISANVPTSTILSEKQHEVFDSNPHEQIVFQFNNEESSDEGCILGV